MVLHNLELLAVDLDQAWLVEAENTGRVNIGDDGDDV